MNYSTIFTQEEYTVIAGPDWPSYADFCQGVPATDINIQNEIDGFIEEKQRYNPIDSESNYLVKNFLTLDSCHGTFIVNRYDQFQPVALVKIGQTHIEHELKNIFEILDLLGNDIIVVDGGANAGFFSLPVSKYINLRRGRVIAIEPQRIMYYALCGTLALNDIDNCWPHNLALGSTQQQISMPPVCYSKFTDFGSVNLRSQKEIPHKEISLCQEKSVNMHTLDSFKLPRLDFVKLDVEGYECQILQGAKETITKCRPWMWVEYYISGIDNIKNHLPFDYICHVVDQFNMVCAPREKFIQANLSFVHD
jgi:FkbM family methyltransferase